MVQHLSTDLWAPESVPLVGKCYGNQRAFLVWPSPCSRRRSSLGWINAGSLLRIHTNKSETMRVVISQRKRQRERERERETERKRDKAVKKCLHTFFA